VEQWNYVLAVYYRLKYLLFVKYTLVLWSLEWLQANRCRFVFDSACRHSIVKSLSGLCKVIDRGWDARDHHGLWTACERVLHELGERVQIIDRSDVASNLSDGAAQTDKALIYLHAFLISNKIDSNLAKTLRACQVNVCNLSYGALALSVYSLNEDWEQQMWTARRFVNKSWSHHSVVHAIAVNLFEFFCVIKVYWNYCCTIHNDDIFVHIFLNGKFAKSAILRQKKVCNFGVVDLDHLTR
jgi:hypothetical protein